jgi:phospholipid-binding lipoprotein MlaA
MPPTPIPLGAALALGLVLVAGGAERAGAQEVRDPRDPWEGYNRAMFSFNETLDRGVVKPLAELYELAAPERVNRAVTNFFSNLNDVVVLFNDLLQLKLDQAASDLSRIVWNTTLGIGGLFDVATHFDLPKHDEDFGQTLGYWGLPPGPYLVLPLLGPSNVRDTVGWAGDITVSPLSSLSDPAAHNSLLALRVVDTRADLLGVTRIAETAALDKYIFVRDAYEQRRRYLVYDGEPPVQPLEE